MSCGGWKAVLVAFLSLDINLMRKHVTTHTTNADVKNNALFTPSPL